LEKHIIMSKSNRTFLIGTNGHILAHVGRTLLIGRELRQRGNRVLFSGQGRFLDLVQRDGFEVVTLGGLDGVHLLSQARRPMVGANMFTAEGFDNFVQLDLKLYEDVQPDAVIFDLQPSMGVSAPLAGIPSIAVANAYVTHYAVTSMTDLIFHPLVRPILEPIRRWKASKPFRQLSSKYNIPPNTIFRDLMTKGDLVLLPDIPEFAPTRNLPNHYHYCGPLVWEPSNGGIPALQGLDPDRPTVYFTLGSTGLPEMFQRIVQDLRDTEYQVILTTGSQVRPDDLRPLPDNFYVDSFFPGSTVLKHCNAMICHGGNGTVYQALKTGRPIVAIPTHIDQKVNAFLMEKLGAGLIVSPQQMEKVLPAVQRILSDPVFEQNAAQMKTHLDGWNGPKTAANLIEAFLEG
jgi:MGT family glycosyltransferase